jgi:V/A-type H+-transporting ATPase subunit E
MSTQLNELIDRIKKEGVDSAQEQADKIVKEAQEQAARIVADAKSQAEAVVAAAKAEAERFELTGREGVRQAGRDVVLDLKGQRTAMLDRIMAKSVSGSLTADVVRDGLVTLFKNWNSEVATQHEALIPEATWTAMQDALLKELAEEMKAGLELKPSPNVRTGFRIGEKDGSAYYDFTDRGLTEFLTEYLNPRLAACLEENKD